MPDIIRQYKADTSDIQVKNQLLNCLLDISNNAETLTHLATSLNKSDRLLWTELRPYIEKVNDMAGLAYRLLQNPQDSTAKSSVDKIDGSTKYQFDMLSGMGSDIKLSKEKAEPAANVLRPFLDWLKCK